MVPPDLLDPAVYFDLIVGIHKTPVEYHGLTRMSDPSPGDALGGVS